MRAIVPNDSVSAPALKNMAVGRQNVGCVPNYIIQAPQKKILPILINSYYFIGGFVDLSDIRLLIEKNYRTGHYRYPDGCAAIAMAKLPSNDYCFFLLEALFWIASQTV